MRTISTLIVGLLMFGQLHAQSETDNFTTYDTTIIYRYNPYLTFTYYLRISRPTNLFTAGSPDTASRPAIFFMPGVGEMNSNEANLYKYGPHYWLANGWDGSVVLGNGKHYPILISMICNVNPPDPPISGNFWVMDYMIHHYHIKPKGVHITGLSEGAFTWAGMLGITDTTGTGTTGADIGCREVTSMTLLSGAATSTGNYSVFGHWAQAYGGKAFLTVGYADAQGINPPLLAAAMNAAVPGSAYFSYNTVAGGGHGGWNTEYDPTQQNWQDFSPVGPYIATGAAPNTPGTYKIGSSIFQWMLRQGDTTLVGGAKPVPVANAGSNQTITLPTNAVTLSGSGTESGGTISSYAWSWVSGPTQYAFNSTSVASPTVSNLTAGTYVFQLTVTDANGASASANVSVLVNPAGGSNTYYNLPGTVQAANYASLSGAVSGSQTLGTTTAIPSITSGESITYNVNVAAAGVYTMSFDVASAASGAGFQLLNSAGAVLTTITVPNTSSSTIWTTVNVVVNLAAGQQTLKILSTQTPTWALNWFSSVAGSAGQQVIPGTIQAENYSTMLGVGTETTGDTGGGLDVGWITYKDYMSYPVNVQTTGTYTVSFRVATANTGASLQLDNGGMTVYANVSIPNTGGWQTWTTVTATVNLTAGVQTIRVLSTGATATWNLNWMSYALASSSNVYFIPGTIQSEYFASSHGVSTQNTSDAGGGQNVDEIYSGDWMSYNVNVTSAGTYNVGLRVASAESGASFALENASGTVYATVPVPNTGGWQTWTTVYATVQLPAGVQVLKVVTLGSPAWNINWMSFSSSSAVVYAIPGMIQAENFSSSLGVSTQNTSDAGGGLNVDEIYSGDWMGYSVNVIAAGNYNVGLRVASAQSGASFALESSTGTVYATVSVPNTGGWQTWTTVSTTVQLPAGAQTLKVVTLGSPAWNINWMSFSTSGTTTSAGTQERTSESLSAFSDSAAAVQAEMLLLYPNPTPDAFLLSMNNPQTGKFLVQVISPSGRLVKTYSFEKGLPEMQVQVSLAGLPAGVYVIRIGGTDWQVIKKVMKL